MNRFVAWLLPLALLASYSIASGAETSSHVRVLSPNGQVGIEFALKKQGDSEAVPLYRVTFKDQTIIDLSRLRIDLENGLFLGGPCLIETVETRSHRAEYGVYPGKRSHVLDHCTETV